jgi:late competence protein required for DNA uptake (superfamily II DNA/RNA helicase)
MIGTFFTGATLTYTGTNPVIVQNREMNLQDTINKNNLPKHLAIIIRAHENAQRPLTTFVTEVHP